MLVLAGSEPVQAFSTLDVVDKVIKIVALLIGGAWAYLNYLRGRTFKKRLELKISAKQIRQQAHLLIGGSAQIKNVGLSKFPIEQKGTAIVLVSLRTFASVELPTDLQEEVIGVREVFKEHAWIEPGETVAEDFLVQLPKIEDHAIKLELRVVAAHIEWNANCIVDTEAKDRATVRTPRTQEV